MSKLRLRMHSLSIFHFAITLTVLLISPLSLFLQTSSFSLSLDLDSSEGDQSVQSLDVSPNRDVSIQIFGTDIQSANALSARFEYNATHVVYTGFDVGDVLPNPFVNPKEGTNPTLVEINIASLDGGSAMVNSGLIGTLRFRTTDAFSGTTIRLVRAALSRGEQFESMTLVGNVALQVFTVPSPDFDGSGMVDSDDFSMFIGHFGTSRGDEAYRDRFDLDSNGTIGVFDFLILTDYFGKAVPVAVGAIDPVTLENDPVTVDVSGNFSDAAALRYTAVSDNESIATVSMAGSEVTIHPVTVGVATITVTATDADGLRAMQDIAVTVRFALAFATSTTRRALDENTSPGEQIGEPVAVRGFNSLTYRLKGTDADSFAIDARTGQIKTREDIAYDFETKNSYWMTVEANDGQGGTASIVVIIKINDVKEPPSSPPSNFLVIPDDESLTVHYHAVPDEEGRPPVRGYHAEIRRGKNGPWGTLKTIYGRTNTSVYYHHIDPEGYHSRILVNGQEYQVRVRAYNSEGASEWSAPVSGTPVYTPPKEKPKLAKFQGEGDMTSADIDLSFSTGEGSRIKVMQAALPATISQEEVEGVFVEIVEVEVSNAPEVPAHSGFTLPGSSSLFDIELKARVNNRDVAIGDGLQTSVEICLPVPADISDPVIVHYDEGASAWEMLDRQRVDGGLVCGYTDVFSLYGVGLRVNRAPVAMGTIVAQTLRVGDAGVTVDVSGKFSDPDGDALTYKASSQDEAIATVAVSGSMVKITSVAVGTTTITVTATDAAGSNQTVEQTIPVTVNKADEKLSFGGATVPDQIYTVGTKIDDLQLPAATGSTGTIGYTLTPALPEGLRLDEETHTISGTPTSAIEKTEYKWRTTDADENTVELTFSITVAPVNQAPHFTSGSTFNVLENTTAVGTVVAEDRNTDYSITGYEVSGGSDQAQFAITDAGVLSFQEAPDYERPEDRDTNNEYIVVVEATSGTNDRALTATQTIVVTVSDVDTEAPGVPDTPTISSSTLNSLTVVWTTPTNTGPSISAYDVRYILSSASAPDKADDSNWTVQENAWTSGDLEYTIGSLTQNTSYDVQVRAENAEGTGVWSSSVTGMTSANQAPVFTSASAVSVNENSTAAIVTVTATDADAGDSITRYEIASDADGSQFEITNAGVVTFKSAPNYEDPTDVAVTDPSNAAGNNEYIVIVSATSGTGARVLTATQTLTVTVTDVDTEAPGKPATPTVASATVNSLKISWSAPTNTGPAISAYDVRYILSSASATDKADDSKWTVQENAWTSGDLEYTISSLTQNIGYDVQVRAENDEGIGSWSSSVTGTTSQNRAPVFASISPPSVSENSTGAVVTVTASDADADDDITGYDIASGADGSQFSIVSSTGVLTFKSAPNYEDPQDVAVTTPSNAASNNEYIVIVSATSGTGARALTATQTLTVTVTDVDTEAPGKPATPTVASATFSSLKISWSAPTNTGPAISAYDVRYILSSASATDKADDSKWTVQENAWTSGDLEYTISSLTQNIGYDVQVRAENDEGIGSWSSSVTGTTSQNRAPVFASISPPSVSENSTGAVVTVTASDADADDDITGYDIASGADGSQFSIVSSTGVLTFKSAPNYEDPQDVAVTTPSNAASNNEYIVIVSATSGTGARALTATQTLTVTVTDVDGEAPGKPTPTVASATVNSLKITWTAPTNTGPAISAYDVRYILSSASDEDKADDSKWTAKEDAWTSGDLEYTISSLAQNTGYDVQVRAENAEGTGDWSDTVVGMTSANQAPVFTSASAISVNENSTAAIVTVTATDADADDNITGYAISSGADQAKFEIVSSTGALSFKTAPDHENPTDVASTTPANDAANNEYIVEVSATSGTSARVLTATQTLTVTVNDVNEPPSSPPANVQVDPSDGEIEVTWDAATDEAGKPPISGYQVERRTGEDGSWGNQQTASGGTTKSFTYTGLTNGQEYQVRVRTVNAEGHSAWSDPPASGTPNIIVAIGSIPAQTLKVNGESVTIDLASYFRYNRAASDINYWATSSTVTVATETVVGSIMTVTPVGEGSTRITARARYGPTDFRATQRVTVTVQSANQLPTFPSTSTTRSMDEHTAAGQNIGAPVTATDADADVLTYSLSGTDANSFELDTNGQIQTKEGVTYNHETKDSYSVTVDVDDGFGGTASIAVTITLNDLDEPPSSFPSNVQVMAGNGQLKVTWDAVTDEAGKPPISGYQIERRTGDNGKWEDLQEVSGRTTTSFIYTGLTNGQEYQVWVRTVNDEGHSGWSATPSGTPIMRSMNQAPTFPSTSTTRSVDENTAAGQNIGDPVTATDGDDDPLTYSLSGTDANSFGIVSSSGQLQTKASVTYDYEAKTSYSVVVGVNDSQGGSDDITVTITLNDVDEPPSSPPANVQVASEEDGQLKVTWVAAADEADKPSISGYQVERRTGKRSPWGNQQTVSDRTTTSFTYTGLTNGQMYQVRVRTVNRDGESDWSDPSASFISGSMANLSETYKQFARARQNDTEPTLPDFSYAGYHHFSKPVPDVRHDQYDVTAPKYGAIPNDDQSDQAAIIAAIADAEAKGSGIIFFPPGEFLVNTDADTTADGKFTTIAIRNSNIVLKGSGSRTGGTVIRQVNSMYKRYLRNVEDNGTSGWPPMFLFRYRGNPSKSTSVTEDATRETFWVTVANASLFNVGEWVTLKMQSTAAIADFMGGRTPSSNWEISASKRGVIVDETHRIAEIQNNRMRFHEPLHANVNSSHGWEVHEYRFLEEVGVEDISFQGSWTGDFVHHKNYIHDYSWYMLQFRGCVNSWVRRVSFINTSIALGINGSAISVYHVTLAGNQGHFAFLGNTDHSWIGLSEDLAGHQHGPNIQGPRSGNVYYRYKYPASLDFHAQKSGEPIATLFDRANGGNLSGSSGVCSRNCPHHLGHFVAWNFHQGPASQHYDFWDQNGRVVINPIIVGFHGSTATFDANTVQLNESQGSAVVPESLFDAQLELRLGTVPAWLKTLRTEWETIRSTSLPEFLPADRTPPVLKRITLQTEEETAGSYTADLKLIYDEELNPVTEVPTNAYTVSIENATGTVNIDGVTIEDDTVTMDLSWTAQAGTTFTVRDVTIDYTPPTHESDRDNKRVEDYGGTPAVSLMGHTFNTAPVFTSGTTFTVEENTQSVGTVVAEDGEDSITGYEVSGGVDQAQFAIANSGALTFQATPDFERPADGDMNNEYIVEVTATSGTNDRELTATQTITVTVTDKDDEKPGTPTAPAVSASTLTSLTVTWTAPTNTGPAISSYDVRHILTSADETDDANWTKAEDAWTSGALKHTIENLEQNKSYDVQVRAESDEGTGDWSSSVTGTTTQNQAPVFVSVSPLSVSENSTGAIVTVSATDADADDNITGYAIVDEADGSQFSIVASTGVLSFKVAPNHESPTDVAVAAPASGAKDNEYIAVVSATGGANARALTTRQTITVTVTDVDEPPSSPPANVQVDPHDGKIKVTWDAATDEVGKPPISGYQVERRTGENGSWGNQQTASGRTTTSLTYTGLTNGQMFQVRVRTVNDEGHSSWSNTPSGTPNIIVAIGSIPAQTLKVNGDPVTIDLASYFRYNRKSSDINYWATSRDLTVATETVNGSIMTVTPVGEGSTLITARSRYGPTNFRATQRVTVTVKPANRMYWVDSGTDKIQRADLDGSNVEDLVTSGLTIPFGIALDTSGGKMYWADRGTDKIQRADLDGSNVEDLITSGLNGPLHIALDVSGGKMYWVDNSTDKIQRANITGTITEIRASVEDLITSGLDVPSGIALDTSGSKMYWADRGTDKIRRADLDGSNAEDLITSGLNSPFGIALDVSGGKMYWVDSGTNKIHRADLDGSNVEDLITGLNDPTDMALDVSGGKMYWVDRGTDKIQRANITGTIAEIRASVEDLITSDLEGPVSIALDL